MLPDAPAITQCPCFPLDLIATRRQRGGALRRALLAVLVVASGCAAEGGAVLADLGRPDHGWSPLADGAPVELHLGAQGGRHLLASVRIDGLWPGAREDGTDDPRVGFTVSAGDGTVWSAALPAVRRRFVPCAAGGFELDGGSRVYLVDGSERALDGAEAELRVDVVDAQGAAAGDARVVEIRVVDDR